jgi:hypothetical protein
MKENTDDDISSNTITIKLKKCLVDSVHVEMMETMVEVRGGG